MIKSLPKEFKPFIKGKEIHLPVELFKEIIKGKYLGCKGWELFQNQDKFDKVASVTFPKLNFIINEEVDVDELEVLLKVEIRNITFNKEFIISNLKIDDLAFWDCIFNNGYTIKNIEFTSVFSVTGFKLWYCEINKKLIIENGSYKYFNIHYSKIDDIIINGANFKGSYKDSEVFEISNSTIKNCFQINNGLFDGAVILGTTDEKNNYINSVEINGAVFNNKFRTESIFGSFRITGGVFNGFLHLVYGVFNEDFVITGGEFKGNFLAELNVFKKDIVISGNKVLLKLLDLGVKKVNGALIIKDVQNVNVTLSKGVYHSIYIKDSVFMDWIMLQGGKVTDGGLNIENCTFTESFSSFLPFSYNSLLVKQSKFLNEATFVHTKNKTISVSILDSQFSNELCVWLTADDIYLSNIHGVKKLNMKKTTVSHSLKIENSSIETIVFNSNITPNNDFISLNNIIRNPITFE